ncbi:MAG: tRNA-dihydrouridine synthase family protein [Bdellovibrionales bacterium]|nr:tRNA-dihydrouridine synthase family protein [Bdellovibrionales bacterium]
MSAKSLGFHKKGLPEEVNFPLCLAPMVGLSHMAFRQMVREYMPEGAVTLWPSEMLNSRRLPHEYLHKIPEAMKAEDENFWMPQILANEEEKIKLSLAKLFDYGAQGVDINMGCPVKKALKHNYGVSLMGDAGYAAEVVSMAVKYSQGPVSVKLRAVGADQKADWIQFVKGLEEAGADWLCLHPRTAEQKRKGQADWSQIKELTENVSVPVIGNGDIQTVDDIIQMIEASGCDMVMAGRVLTARPWLMWQLGEKLGWPNPLGKEGAAPSTPEEEGVEYGKSLLRLLDLMKENFPERLALRKFIFHVKTGAVWLPFGHFLYGQVDGAKEFDQLYEVVDKFFSSPHRMLQKTELRE